MMHVYVLMSVCIIILSGVAFRQLTRKKVALKNGALVLLVVISYIFWIMLTLKRGAAPVLWHIFVYILLGLGCVGSLWGLRITASFYRSILATWRNPRFLSINLTLIILMFSSVCLLLLTGLVWLTQSKDWEKVLILSWVIVGYFVYWWFAFGIAFIIYRIQLKRPVRIDYILVLGAGLVDGNQLSSTLRGRLDTALSFAQNLSNQLPILIMSGGCGPDEQITEAEVMANYAIQQGYPTDLIQLETAATSTHENMVFSQALLVKRHQNAQAGLFVTSDYHLFRSALWAQAVNLSSVGFGSKTQRQYFWPAYMREYFAVMYWHKWGHLVGLGLSLGLMWLLIK